MDTIRIPNFYFDLIARCVPGATLLAGLYFAADLHVMSNLAEIFLYDPSLRESPFVWTVFILAATYIGGHLLSPFVRWLENSPRAPVLSESSPQNDRVKKNISPLKKRRMVSTGIFASLYQWLRKVLARQCWDEALTRYPKAEYQGRYNKLRFEHPVAADLAIRIRAEYTMYGGIALSLGVSLVIALFRFLFYTSRVKFLWVGWFVWPQVKGITTSQLFICALICAGILGLVAILLRRHCDTYTHFCITVDQLASAAEDLRKQASSENTQKQTSS